MINRDLGLLTDFYELTMSNGYFKSNMSNRIVYFDMFFRTVPDNGGFAIMSGVEQLIESIEAFKFSDDDIEYLWEKKVFDDQFLKYLKNFEFKCDIWSVREGLPIFPIEPIITVKGPIIQAQLIETILLMCISHQSLIATKTNRIVRAASGRKVVEFGARRAHGFDAAMYGARAAYVGGACGTSCTILDKMYKIPALGTMGHSWVQMFDSELEAFRAYARTYPENCLLLIDTYNVLKSGVPNAIRIFNEEVVTRGYRPVGVRIDSGDITYLSNKIRKDLDDAGFQDAQICVSNSLDEYVIRDMVIQGAKVDMFGVGERLITSSSSPILGGVYKLSAIEDETGKVIPKIKISENTTKINIPGIKEVYRLFDKKSSNAIADVITEVDERMDNQKQYKLFDPEYTWKRKIVSDFEAVKLREQIISKGKRCIPKTSLQEIQLFCKQQVDMLWDEVKRFENPHYYYVDLSYALWKKRNDLIKLFNC